MNICLHEHVKIVAESSSQHDKKYVVPSPLTSEINNLSSTFDGSQSDVNVNSHNDLYLRPYIISHNLQYGYIIGTLKHKFGLRLQREMGENG
jgi:hypothetical protein